MGEEFTFYSFIGSQWAGVVDLTIAEKGLTNFVTRYIDLYAAENFDPNYLRINPNGTVPSLTSPALQGPLADSADILRFLDGLSQSGAALVPKDPETRNRGRAVMELVHSSQVDTNVILLQCRNADEMREKKQSAGVFLATRQEKLDKEAAADPSHAFYGPKAEANRAVHEIYATPISAKHEKFFEQTQEAYRAFAQGMEKLDGLLVLPFAAGESVTEADFHVIPWLSHAMMAAGTPKDEVANLDVLEKVLRESSPGFTIGKRTREWWENVSRLEAFRKVFSFVH